MAKDFWSKFDWAAWQTDPGLRLCSKAAKGVWMDFLAFAFRCEYPGKATVKERPLTLDQVAKSIDGDTAENAACLQELFENNVMRQDDDGAFYSKRMIEEYELRTKRAEAGSRGGSVTAAKRQANTPANEQQTLSDSDSDSQKKKTANEFDAFWDAYPKKVGKPTARKKWKDHYLDAIAGEVMAGLERCKRSKQWQKDGGDFVPHPTTWLNREGWHDELDGTTVQKTTKAAWDALPPATRAELLKAVQDADPSVDHRAGNMDTQRAMRKLAKERGLI